MTLLRICISIFAINSLSFYRRFVSASGMGLQTIRGDGHGGKGVQILPKDNSYENVVIFLHGLGDSCDGWSQLMPEFGLSKTKYILPSASSIPISINGGYEMPGWSDIFGLDMEAKEDRVGFDESKKRIEKLIDAEIEKGIEPRKIILGGFSQGGATSLHTGLRYKATLGGIVALSTWLPFRDDFPDALSQGGKNVPIFQVHGDQDAVVSFKWGKNTNDLLKTFMQIPPSFLTIQGMGHSSNPQEIRELKKFLESKLN